MRAKKTFFFKCLFRTLYCRDEKCKENEIEQKEEEEEEASERKNMFHSMLLLMKHYNSRMWNGMKSGSENIKTKPERK